MIYLISAPPRTGKTLFAVKKIFEYLNQGRFVYTNIDGINIPGVFTIEDSHENPFDWRKLPHGSVIFFDEAQKHLAFTSRKIPKPYAHKSEEILKIGDDFDTHGHDGYDIILLTQKPNLLRSDILGFVSVHYIMRRKWGQNFATIWEFGEAITTWGKSTADSALNKTQFFYPKHLYKYYKSASMHNVPKTFPKKYLIFLLIPLFMFYYAYGNAKETGFFGLFEPQQVEQQLQQVNQDRPPIKTISKDADVDEELLKLQAENMGITVQQLKDLKNPEIKNAQYAEIHNQYNIQNPFDYSYLKGSTDRLFSGCIYSKKQGYIAYDQQGSVIDGIDQSVCKRVIEKGERPYTPRSQNYESQMVNQNNNHETFKNSAEQNVQPNVEHHQANNIVPDHLQARTVNGANQL